MDHESAIDKFLAHCSNNAQNNEASTVSDDIAQEVCIGSCLPDAFLLSSLLEASLWPENACDIAAHADLLVAWLCNFPDKLRNKTITVTLEDEKRYYDSVYQALEKSCKTCVRRLEHSENADISFLAKVLTKFLLIAKNDLLLKFVALVAQNGQADFKWRKFCAVLQTKLPTTALVRLVRVLAEHASSLANLQAPRSLIGFICCFGTRVQPTSLQQKALESYVLDLGCNEENFRNVASVLHYLSSLENQQDVFLPLLKKLLTFWADQWFIREERISSQVLVSAFVVKSFQLMHTAAAAAAASSNAAQQPATKQFQLELMDIYRTGMHLRLTSPCLRTRTVGMYVAEHIFDQLFIIPAAGDLADSTRSEKTVEKLSFDDVTKDFTIVSELDHLLGFATIADVEPEAEKSNTAVLSSTSEAAVDDSAEKNDDNDDFVPLNHNKQLSQNNNVAASSSSNQQQSLKQFRLTPHYVFQIKEFLENGEQSSHREQLHAHLLLLVKALENDHDAARCYFDDLFQLLNHVQIPDDDDVERNHVLHELRMAALVRLARCDYKRAANVIVTQSLCDANYSLGMKSRMLQVVRAIADDRPLQQQQTNNLCTKPRFLIEVDDDHDDDASAKRLLPYNIDDAHEEEPDWKKVVQERISQKTRIKSSSRAARQASTSIVAPDIFANVANHFLFRLIDVNPRLPRVFNAMPALTAEWLATVAHVLRHAKNSPQLADMLCHSVRLFYAFRAHEEPCVRQAVCTGMAVAFATAPPKMLFSSLGAVGTGGGDTSLMSDICQWFERVLTNGEEKHEMCRNALLHAAACASRASQKFVVAQQQQTSKGIVFLNADNASSKSQFGALMQLSNFLP